MSVVRLYRYTLYSLFAMAEKTWFYKDNLSFYKKKKSNLYCKRILRNLCLFKNIGILQKR